MQGKRRANLAFKFHFPSSANKDKKGNVYVCEGRGNTLEMEDYAS